MITITETTKQTIAAAAFAYAKNNNISNNLMAQQAEVNVAYVSRIANGFFTTNAGAPIGDKNFIQLAAWCGHELQAKIMRPQVTRQFAEILNTLTAAKKAGTAAMIIGFTGVGKTYAIEKFVYKNPLHTYRLTVAKWDKLADIINALCAKLGIEMKELTYGTGRSHSYSYRTRMDKIIDKLRDIQLTGGKPQLIIDEGENLTIDCLQTIKGLYDGVKDYCSIVLIGTEQLTEKLLNRRTRHRDGIPQLYRRFKAGNKQLSPVTNDDKLAFIKEYVRCKGLQKLLCQLCENYGELHDYLEPALQEAAAQNVALTEELFRIKYNMPYEK